MTERSAARAIKTKDIITQTHTLFEDLLDIQSSVRGYVITNDPVYLDPYETAVQRIHANINLLKASVSDRPEQRDRLEELARDAEERMIIAANLKGLVDKGQRDEAQAYVRSGVGKQAMDEFRRRMGLFLNEEEMLDEAARREVEESWRQMDRLIIGGALANLMLAFSLAFFFSRGIARRLETLSQNARALASGKTLSPPLSGSDEIAELDRTFHQMAAELQKSRDELEIKVEERTRELSLATEEINKMNDELEKRVVERTAQLEAANKELEAFSYSVSHDLRAPLRAIDGFSRILLEDYSNILDEEGSRILNVVRRNAQNMGQLIDDLLAFSRLGRKQLEPGPINMDELARDVCKQLNTENLDVRIEALPETLGDKSLVRQVWINLISNALKYSRKKENPRVEIGARTGTEENIFYVRDNGVGFDMKYVNKLFGVFQRLHSNEEFEGTGVGLAIVQRIVHRHGGRVWAEGEVGEGAVFYFSLPSNNFNQRKSENES